MFILIILLMTEYVSGKVYRRDDILSPSFNKSDLEVLKVFTRRKAGCEEVEEKVTVLKYDFLDEDTGKVVKAKVDRIDVVEEKSFYFDQIQPWLTGSIQIKPELFCKDQTDPDLVEKIKKEHLHPPSSKPYAFNHNDDLYGKLPSTTLPYADGQPSVLDQTYFHEGKKGGFFIEAGAYDGERASTTLHFELNHGWTGLLIEPMPILFQELLSKNRKAWAVQSCLSTVQKPQMVNFSMEASSSEDVMYGISPNSTSTKTVSMQCLPLYSLLLALGNPTVDYLSLDIEGAELAVLRTIPWDKVHIRALSIETQFAGQVMQGSRQDIITYLTSLGYTHLARVSRDDLFVLLDSGGTSPALTTEQLMMKVTPRRCVYFRVEEEELATHCRRSLPRDYFQDKDPAKLPECVVRKQCPAGWDELMDTFMVRSPWTSQLTDPCFVVDQDIHVF